uniref:Uncharacterized protein n=1 Tax=uncultured bacterium contig00036 TaxID=1181524 RepID=A0A806K0Z3_9BACT|nr:hypothetical protein [uncultured bacterium contig00036]
MSEYTDIFDEEKNEIMRDLRDRQAEVREMYKHFDENPHLWAEHDAKLEAEGWKFVDFSKGKPLHIAENQ